MDYVKKTITLPADLNSRLAEEKNASATIAEALSKHYEAKDSLKKLVQLVEEFSEEDFDLSALEAELKVIKADIKNLLRLAGGY